MAFDAGELESAISSVIFEIVEREKSVSSAASQVRCTSVFSNATVVFLCVILSIVVWLRKEAKIKDESNCAVVYAERFLIVQSLLFLLENTVKKLPFSMTSYLFFPLYYNHTFLGV